MFDLDAWIKTYLREEETVLWTGRPGPPRRLRPKDFFEAWIGTFIRVPVFFFLPYIALPPLGFPHLEYVRELLSALIGLVSFFAVAIRVFIVRKRLKHYFYILTAIRAIILFATEWSSSTASHELDPNTALKVMPQSENTVDLAIGSLTALLRFDRWHRRMLAPIRSGFQGDYLIFKELDKTDADRAAAVANGVLERQTNAP